MWGTSARAPVWKGRGDGASWNVPSGEGLWEVFSRKRFKIENSFLTFDMFYATVLFQTGRFS